jgi:putative two-component system response regulator
MADAATASGRILVVDDEAPNRRLLSRMLTLEGYTVETADDGESALPLIDRQPWDLILLDVRMPGLGGFDVCRRVKSSDRTRLTPVVLVTGLSDRDSRIEGIDAGADDFLSKPFDAQELKARVRSLVRIGQYTRDLDSAEAIIMSLARTIEARDAYTQGHCERLAAYSGVLGGHLGLSGLELAALQRGAFLHDIGKVGVPDAILLKPTALTPDEYEVMKRHTIVGDGLCGTLRSLALARPIVRFHHERRDGSGYPDGLRGDAIPLSAQIVGIVDTYDAITTLRPYHPARPPEEAYRELQSEVARGWRRADLVDALVGLGRAGKLVWDPDLPFMSAAPSLT